MTRRQRPRASHIEGFVGEGMDTDVAEGDDLLAAPIGNGKADANVLAMRAVGRAQDRAQPRRRDMMLTGNSESPAACAAKAPTWLKVVTRDVERSER